MAVEGLPGYPEFFAEVANVGFFLAHGGHGQADFGRCHLVRATAVSPSGARGSGASDRTFGDQGTFKLRERSKDAKNKLPRRSSGVNGRTLTCKNFETDTAVSQIMNGVNQVTEIATEPVELPHQKGVPLTECLQTRRQMRTVILLPRSLILIEVPRLDSGDQERIPLKIGALRSIGFRYPQVPDEQARPRSFIRSIT